MGRNSLQYCNVTTIILTFQCCLIWILFTATDSQETCRYSSNTVGVCALYQDCTELRGKVIFPNTICEPGQICCPREATPDLKIKSTTSTPPAAFGIIAVSTHAPPANNIQAVNPIPAQIELVTTTELPVKRNIMDSFNPRGLNILHSQKCGFVSASKNPNGTNVEADILEFPWMALLQYEDANGQKQFNCGGSLITERWVLTAAQCIKPNLVGVRLGEYDLNTKKDCTKEAGMKTCTQYKDFMISAAVPHPEFDQNARLKDIGLIKLKTRAQRNKNIKPICLPTQPELFDAPYNEQNVLIAGWKSREQDSSTILKKHIVRQQRPFVCNISLLFMPNDTDESKLCLDSCDDQLSICSGDPGSPVFWLIKNETEFYTQIGIVPFGMDKCGKGDELSYRYNVERVADSMDWITTVISENK